MIKNIVLVLFLGITVFSMVKYRIELKARYALQEELSKAQDQITVLANEKQNLLQDLKKEQELKEQLGQKNTALKDNLRASVKRISRLFNDSGKAQAELEEVEGRLSILKAENRALIEGRKKIQTENEQFKIRLGSISELKQVIRDLKEKRRNNSDLALEGNRGFLLKDGRSTVKIEVIPAQKP